MKRASKKLKKKQVVKKTKEEILLDELEKLSNDVSPENLRSKLDLYSTSLPGGSSDEEKIYIEDIPEQVEFQVADFEEEEKMILIGPRNENEKLKRYKKCLRCGKTILPLMLHYDSLIEFKLRLYQYNITSSKFFKLFIKLALEKNKEFERLFFKYAVKNGYISFAPSNIGGRGARGMIKHIMELKKIKSAFKTNRTSVNYVFNLLNQEEIEKNVKEILGLSEKDEDNDEM